MEIAVRYKKEGNKHQPITIIVDIPEDIRYDEDSYHDACYEAVEEIIGESPKWIRVLGQISIMELFTKFKF